MSEESKKERVELKKPAPKKEAKLDAYLNCQKGKIAFGSYVVMPGETFTKKDVPKHLQANVDYALKIGLIEKA